MGGSEIDILLKKYLRGTISPDEAERLRRLSNLSNDSELDTLFGQQWEGYEMPESQNIQEVQAISKKVYQKLQSGRRTFFIRQWMRIAVSLLLLVSLGLSAYLLIDNRKMRQLGGREIIVRVDKGQQAGVTLPDGSTVRLNSASVLSYRQDFGNQTREVELSGEGYFKVVKDASRKFVVNTQFVDVEVLGTSFNFYAYAYESKDEVELTLVEGKVSLRTNTLPAQSVVLEPNSKAVYNKNTGILDVKRTSTEFETAWCANELVFRSETLRGVFSKIERRYGVVIRTEKNSVPEGTYTGVFDKEDLSDVMKILSIHFDFSYQIEEDTVTIKPRE